MNGGSGVSIGSGVLGIYDNDLYILSLVFVGDV